MMSWNYIVIIPCLVLVVFLFRKESMRQNMLRLPMRITASIIAVAALACLVLPVWIKVTGETATPSATYVWLTQGYHADSLGQFSTNLKKQVLVYTSDPAVMRTASAYHPSLLLTAAMVTDSLKQPAPLHVFGYGLTAYEINMLRGHPVVFHPSPLPTGITTVSWQRRIKQTAPLVVQGNFNNAGPAPVKLILDGLHTHLDSVVIPSGKQQSFQLAAVPKNTGRNVYSLVALSGADTMEMEKIPFEIDSTRPLKILLLAASPDFENRYLKDWLFKNGFQITSRTTISRNKYQKDFLNSKEIYLDRITTAVLDQMDLVISDAEELAAFSSGEQGALKSAVARGGLGLIIKADSFPAPGTFYAQPFPLYSKRGDTLRQSLLHGHTFDKKMPVLSISNPVFIKKLPGTQPLVYNQGSGIHISTTLHGAGKIGVTTLSNTFSWMLAGYDSAYYDLWSSIIQKVARKPGGHQNWYLEPALPRVNEQVQIRLSSNTTALPGMQVAGISVYPRQDRYLFSEWDGTFWPVTAGWQTVKETGSPGRWLYIYHQNEWKTVQAHEKYMQTSNYALKYRPLTDTIQHPERKETRKQVPKQFFFLAVLLSCGYLWWEKKYSVV